MQVDYGQKRRNLKRVITHAWDPETMEMYDSPKIIVDYVNDRFNDREVDAPIDMSTGKRIGNEAKIKIKGENNAWDNFKCQPAFDPREIQEYYCVNLKIEDQEAFDKLIDDTGIQLTDATRAIWYPMQKHRRSYKYIQTDPNNEAYKPKYPVYIVSKSRWEKRPTSDALVAMGVKHYIVVEEHQVEEYKKRVNPDFVTILTLDKRFLEEYEVCDDLGDTRSKGPGAARNFAWWHSKEVLGAKRHWVMDDNARGFTRVDGNKRYPVYDGAALRSCEDHTDQFENVAISGMNYESFAIPRWHLPPFVINTRIYSCLLILNDIDYYWRGRYNEDTDLSLRVLKDGWCTIQYNHFLYGKLGTQVMKGGNTEAFYAAEGTKPKSQMLVDLHPDCSRMEWKFGRWHHSVDYFRFKSNQLIYTPEAAAMEDVQNEYGLMKVEVELTDEEIADMLNAESDAIDNIENEAENG